MDNNTMAYLITPAAYLKSFKYEADRAYFSAPIPVRLLYSERSTRLLFVQDPATGNTFPTLPANLRTAYQLTGRQRGLVKARAAAAAA